MAPILAEWTLKVSSSKVHTRYSFTPGACCVARLRAHAGDADDGVHGHSVTSGCEPIYVEEGPNVEVGKEYFTSVPAEPDFEISMY